MPEEGFLGTGGVVGAGGGAISPLIGSGSVPGGAGQSALQHNKGKEKLSEGLKMCYEILKELFAKKHRVSNLKNIQICV